MTRLKKIIRPQCVGESSSPSLSRPGHRLPYPIFSKPNSTALRAAAAASGHSPLPSLPLNRP
ncbi:MAG TPA: hypothetical protein VI547_12975 [Anaerolineales bacterium]|nr:hypothetical protein [Anaerolineales bacterium]